MSAKTRMKRIRMMAHELHQTTMLDLPYRAALAEAQHEVLGGWHRHLKVRRHDPYAYYTAGEDRFMASYGLCSVHYFSSRGGHARHILHARHDGDGICPKCGQEVAR